MVHSAVIIICNAFYKYLDIDSDAVIAYLNATLTFKSIFTVFFFFSEKIPFAF